MVRRGSIGAIALEGKNSAMTTLSENDVFGEWKMKVRNQKILRVFGSLNWREILWKLLQNKSRIWHNCGIKIKGLLSFAIY